MGFILVIVGAILNYFGWKLLLSIQDKEVNRHFRALICVGMVLVVAGVASFFV
jgi:hypothetical protein